MTAAYHIKSPITQGCAIGGLQDLALWQALVGMVNERIAAANASGSESITAIAFPQDGANLEPATYLAGMQSAILSMLFSFANHTITAGIEGDTTHGFLNRPDTEGALWSGGVPITGSGFTPALWTFPPIRTAAAVASTNDNGVGVLNDQWVRFRPREILTAADVADTQGNAAAPGQAALNAGDKGRVYVCASSGSWSRNDSLVVDVLSNAQAAPNAVSPVGADDGNILGYMQSGDYIFFDQLEEIRLICNLLREVWYGINLSVVGMPHPAISMVMTGVTATATVTAPTSNASLPGTLATNWAAATPAVSGAASSDLLSPRIFYTSLWIDPGTGAPHEAWTLSAEIEQTATTIPAAAIGHSVRWLGWIQNQTNDISPGNSTVAEAIDPQGASGVAASAYHVFNSPATSYLTTETYQYLSVASLPPDQPAYINTSHSGGNLTERVLGWQAVDVIALVNYYPGFQYTF